jgi:hypothetical protein
MISHEEKMHSSLDTLMISNHVRRCATTSKNTLWSNHMNGKMHYSTSTNTLMIKSHEEKMHVSSSSSSLCAIFWLTEIDLCTYFSTSIRRIGGKFFFPLWQLAWLTCIQSVGCIEDARRRVFNKMPSQDGVRTCEMWARLEGIGTILTNMQQEVCALYEICSAWHGRRRRRRRGIAICITIVRNWLLHLGLINTASWYSSPNKKKSE